MYRISLLFISQMFTDIPKEIRGNLTKLLAHRIQLSNDIKMIKETKGLKITDDIDQIRY